MADRVSELLRDIPDSPAGRQVRWDLTMRMTEGEGASIDDLSSGRLDAGRPHGEGLDLAGKRAQHVCAWR